MNDEELVRRFRGGDDAIRRSRVAALKAFGERLVANVNAFKPVPPGQ